MTDPAPGEDLDVVPGMFRDAAPTEQDELDQLDPNYREVDE